jgi:cytochrome b-561
MVGVWTGHYLDGFAWDGSGKEFNYHPVFMIVSMIFLNSQGIYLKYAWLNFSQTLKLQ